MNKRKSNRLDEHNDGDDGMEKGTVQMADDFLSRSWRINYEHLMNLRPCTMERRNSHTRGIMCCLVPTIVNNCGMVEMTRGPKRRTLTKQAVGSNLLLSSVVYAQRDMIRPLHYRKPNQNTVRGRLDGLLVINCTVASQSLGRALPSYACPPVAPSYECSKTTSNTTSRSSWTG